MKKKILLCVLTTIIVSCNKKKDLNLVFKHHGGVENWNNQKVLSFNIGNEAHTIDLVSKKIVINSSSYSLGFDGKEVWVSKDNSSSFVKEPKTYYDKFYNLYAMPFLLADKNAVYTKILPLKHQGKEYKGYEVKQGNKSYKVYYDSETHQMEWLSYENEILKYNWNTVNNFVLPKSIQWFNKDANGNLIKFDKSIKFTLPLLTQAQLADSFFEKPNKYMK